MILQQIYSGNGVPCFVSIAIYYKKHFGLFFWTQCKSVKQEKTSGIPERIMWRLALYVCETWILKKRGKQQIFAIECYRWALQINSSRKLQSGASIPWGNDARCVIEISGGGGKNCLKFCIM